MSARPTDLFDLGTLRLGSGEGRRLELDVAQDPLELAASSYRVLPELAPVIVEVSRMTGGGYALRLRATATLHGPCMRCLAQAQPIVVVDVREVELPGAGDELDSPYVQAELLDVRAWLHDAVVLAAPDQVLCAPDCPGLCPVCAVPLASAPNDHRHEREPDPRWAKLREIDIS
jgi:uncharacterized protein